MMIALDRFVNGTKLGRGIRATAQDPETAVLLGVNINAVVVVTFLVGGIMAGAAGFFWVLFYEVTKFNIGFILGIKAFTAAVLGGIGNLRGALVGGFVLGLRGELRRCDLRIPVEGRDRLHHAGRHPHVPSHRHPR